MSGTIKLRPENVDVRESGRGKFTVDIVAGSHAQVADESTAVGGNDSGPRLMIVLAGLGACTAMTIRMYADWKGIPLKERCSASQSPQG